MSNSSSYSLMDDDQIDDQQTMINVQNLILDLESNIDEDTTENRQTNVKPVTTSSASSSEGSAFAVGANSNSTVKHSRSSSKHSSNNNSNINNNNNISNNTNNTNNNKSSSTINYMPEGRLTNISTIAGNNNNNNNNNSNNPNNGTSARAVFKSSSDDRGELKMRITRETKPGKSEHKIVTSPNQKSPTSSSGVGFVSLSGDHPELDDQNLDYIQKQGSSSISSTKECGTSTSVGTITEPDCLGPCEPGTSVSLEGIVWQETEGGILVVNVTWRGKTYVGALLDCTKHDWAPPRLCDSPTSDIDSKASKGVRPKRIVTRSNGASLDEKNVLQTTGKLRNGKGRRILPPSDLTPCSKRQRESDKSSENPAAQTDAVSLVENNSTVANSETRGVPTITDTKIAPECENAKAKVVDSGQKPGPNSPMLIGCSEPNCSKKYRNLNGLSYHKAHAHSSNNESNAGIDGDCSSTSKKNQIDPSSVEVQNDDDNKSGTKHTEQTKEKNELSSQTEKSSLAPSIVISDQKLSHRSEARQEPSPLTSSKYMSSRSESAPHNDATHNNESRSNSTKIPDLQERRNSTHIAPGGSTNDKARLDRSPPRLIMDIPQGLQPGVIHTNNNNNANNTNNNNNNNNNHHHHHPHQYQQQHQHQQHQPQQPQQHQQLQQQQQQSPSMSSSSKHPAPSKQIPNQANNPGPPTNDEGMKPSGTSTGPPPAPHQANCYLNSAFLTNYNLNPPFFPRPPLPIYDPPTSSQSALLSRFMSQLRPPNQAGPESPLMIHKNTPFAPFKPETNALPQLPNQHVGNPPPLPPLPLGSNLPPLGNQQPLHPPTMGGNGSPHLRLPSQVDSMMPPTSQGLMPPLPFPMGANLPPFPPHLLSSMGRPPAPGMMDDPQGKPYPGARFN